MPVLENPTSLKIDDAAKAKKSHNMTFQDRSDDEHEGAGSSNIMIASMTMPYLSGNWLKAKLGLFRAAIYCRKASKKKSYNKEKSSLNLSFK